MGSNQDQLQRSTIVFLSSIVLLAWVVTAVGNGSTSCAFGGLVQPTYSQATIAGQFTQPFYAVIKQLSDAETNLTGTLPVHIDGLPNCDLATLVPAINHAAGKQALPNIQLGGLADGSCPDGASTALAATTVAPLQLTGSNHADGDIEMQSGTKVANFTIDGVKIVLSSNSSIQDLASSPWASSPEAAAVNHVAQQLSQQPAVLSVLPVAAPGIACALAGNATAVTSLAPTTGMSLAGRSIAVQLLGLLLVVQDAQGSKQVALALPNVTVNYPISTDAGAFKIEGNATVYLSLWAWLVPSNTATAPSPTLSPQLAAAVQALLQPTLVGPADAAPAAPAAAASTAPAATNTAQATPSTTAAAPSTGQATSGAPRAAPETVSAAAEEAPAAASGEQASTSGDVCDPVSQAPASTFPAGSSSISCTCRPGWSGQGCSICSADAVQQQGTCQALLRHARPGVKDNALQDLTCNTDGAYNGNTAYLSRHCNITGSMGTLLEQADIYCSPSGIYPPWFSYYSTITSELEALYGKPNTTASSGSLSLSSMSSMMQDAAGSKQEGRIPPYCVLVLKMGKIYNYATLSCRLMGCTFVTGKGEAKCSGPVACGCPDASTGMLATCEGSVQAIVKAVTGALTMVCDASTPSATAGGQNCKMGMQGLATEIDGLCNAASCEGKATAGLAQLSTESIEPARVKDWLPVISCVPLIVTALYALACTAYLIINCKLFKLAYTDIPMSSSRPGTPGAPFMSSAPTPIPGARGAIAESTEEAPQMINGYAPEPSMIQLLAPRAPTPPPTPPPEDALSLHMMFTAGNRQLYLRFQNICVHVPVMVHAHAQPRRWMPRWQGLRHNKPEGGVPDDALRAVPQGMVAERPSDGSEATPTVNGFSLSAPVAALLRADAQQPNTAVATAGQGQPPRVRQTACILSNVTGQVACGQLCGVLGPSGAGKTALLSCLSGSTSDLGRGARMTGTVALMAAAATQEDVDQCPSGPAAYQQRPATPSGVIDSAHTGVGTAGGQLAAAASPAGSLHHTARVASTVVAHGKDLRKVTAFVAQHDILPPTLTVCECLLLSALLRLPHTTPAVEIKERLHHVVQELSLQPVAHRLVGMGPGSMGGHATAAAQPTWMSDIARKVGATAHELLHIASFGMLGGVPGAAGSRGLSGGERRRVSIGMELMIQPQVVIMDEPTSGLDSYTAVNLLSVCKRLSRAGRAVILSLHQPSPDMVANLDLLILMAPGGQVAYLGPPGDAAEAWLAAGHLPVARNTSLAEHLLGLVSNADSAAALLAHYHQAYGSEQYNRQPLLPGDTVDVAVAAATGSRKGVEEQMKGEEAHKQYSALKDIEGGVGDVEGGSTASSVEAGGSGRGRGRERGTQAVVAAPEDATTQHVYRAKEPSTLRYKLGHVMRQCGVLFWRSLRDAQRNPTLLTLHVGLALFTGLMVGLIFFQQEDTFAGAQNRAGVLFFSLTLTGFTALTVVDVLMLDRALLRREARRGYYHPCSYLGGRLSLDTLLLRAVPAVLYVALVYPLVGLQPGVARVATLILVLASFGAVVGALSVCVAAMVDTPGKATLVMNLILLLWVLLGGFLVNSESIPVWISWLRYVCPLPYAFEGLVANEVRGMNFAITVPGVPEVDGVRGESLMQAIGLNPDRAEQDVGVIVAFYAAFIVLAFIQCSLEH